MHFLSCLCCLIIFATLGFCFYLLFISCNHLEKINKTWGPRGLPDISCRRLRRRFLSRKLNGWKQFLDQNRSFRHFEQKSSKAQVITKLGCYWTAVVEHTTHDPDFMCSIPTCCRTISHFFLSLDQGKKSNLVTYVSRRLNVVWSKPKAPIFFELNKTG